MLHTIALDANYHQLLMGSPFTVDYLPVVPATVGHGDVLVPTDWYRLSVEFITGCGLAINSRDPSLIP